VRHEKAGDGIRDLVEPWARRYRRDLVLLACFGLLSGVSVFFENAALESLSRAIASVAGRVVEKTTSAPGPLAVVTGVGRRFLGAKPPLFILAVMLGGRLFRLLMSTLTFVVGGKVRNRTRSDIESRVLADLLRKEPGFFTSRPGGEILNRLGDDVGRIAAGRIAHAERYEALFGMAGNILFFVDADARMALLSVLLCALGVWGMHRVSQPARESDRLALTADDAVKGRFEELLGMTQEIQINNLSARVRSAFERVQERRQRLLDQYVALSSLVGVVATVAYVLSLGSLIVVALYFLRVPNPDARAALIPVMLRALPDLFTFAMMLIQQNVTKRLARTSAQRLLDYEEDEAPLRSGDRASAPRSGAAITVREATFQYTTSGGGLAGGVRGVTTSFAPGRSTAIVGAAGSGKSTLLQLLLGQLQPQSGAITLDATSIGSLSPAERAAQMALMPQTIALFDGTIAENLYFGGDPPDPIAGEDRALLDQLGVLEMCRTRALDVAARKDSVSDDVRRRVVEARARIAERLDAAGMKVVPATRETPSTYWLAEHLLAGRADRPQVLPALRTREAMRVVRATGSSPAAAPLVEWAETLVTGSKHWLTLDNYAVSAKLAPFPIEPDVWELRRACAAAEPTAGADRRAELLRVALTSSFAELQSACGLSDVDRGRVDAAALGDLRRLLGDVVVPLEEGAVHPLLSWRDNLVFASMTITNRRQEALVDRVVVEESLAAGLGPALERSGLGVGVGRAGSRLSGGQRQLIALSRTLLRRTPVVILDEPTSALDPANRARVAKVLDAWKKDRVVIVVTHDPELARACDDVRLLERGQVVGSGPFAEVAPRSAVFQQSAGA
jgi:ABC-type multidrug transport system fused ATPase/permease subunit